MTGWEKKLRWIATKKNKIVVGFVWSERNHTHKERTCGMEGHGRSWKDTRAKNTVEFASPALQAVMQIRKISMKATHKPFLLVKTAHYFLPHQQQQAKNCTQDTDRHRKTTYTCSSHTFITHKKQGGKTRIKITRGAKPLHTQSHPNIPWFIVVVDSILLYWHCLLGRYCVSHHC